MHCKSSTQKVELRTMGNNSIVIICVLVCAISMGAIKVQGQLGLGNLLGIVRIQGTVFCTANGNMGVNGTSTPVFPNALVQLRCGNGNVVSTVSTNNAGIFSILLDPLQFLLSTILSNCNIVVNTPLSSCNANLPSLGVLLSPLQLIGNTVLGLLSIVNVIPVRFQFLTSIN